MELATACRSEPDSHEFQPAINATSHQTMRISPAPRAHRQDIQRGRRARHPRRRPRRGTAQDSHTAHARARENSESSSRMRHRSACATRKRARTLAHSVLCRRFPRMPLWHVPHVQSRPPASTATQWGPSDPSPVPLATVGCPTVACTDDITTPRSASTRVGSNRPRLSPCPRLPCAPCPHVYSAPSAVT